MNLGIAELSLDAAAGAAPVTGTSFSIPTTGNTITWITSYGTTPVSITIQLQTSNDNSTWAITDTSTNAAGESRSIFTAAKFVRAVESARSGGSTVTVSIIAKASPVTNTALTSSSDISIASITATSSGAFGASPASSVGGPLRIPYNSCLSSRNSGGTADVCMGFIGPGDMLYTPTINGSGNSNITNFSTIQPLTYLCIQGKTCQTSTANGLQEMKRNDITTTGIQFNYGTALPTSTPCTFATGSNNTAGQMTAVGVTTCTLTFGAPNWSFAPFCTATEVTAARALFISASSVSAITVSGLTAGDVFNYNCFGRAF